MLTSAALPPNTSHESGIFSALLNQTEQHLTSDALNILAPSVAAQLFLRRLLLLLAVDTDRRQVVEHQRELGIEQRQQDLLKLRLDRRAGAGQGVQAPQQPLVRDRLGLDPRQPNPFEPAQDAELGLWIGQAVEHHHARQRFGIEGAARRTQPLLNGPVEPEIAPQFVEQPPAAELQRRQSRDVQCPAFDLGATGRPQQPVDQRIDLLGVDVLEPPEGGEGAMLDLARLAVGFDDAQVGARAGAMELDVHGVTIARQRSAYEADRYQSAALHHHQAGALKCLKILEWASRRG